MYYHSIQLDEEKCRGCTICIKGCPTEAIRVHKGKAHILAERCIDCGECLRTCPSGAKQAVSDSIKSINKYSYPVAIVAPALYGQFDLKYSRNKILNGLKQLGFKEVIEVARAAEEISEATKQFIKDYKGDAPLLSSSCPVIVRLIQSRFPSLLESLVPLISPMELCAREVVNNHPQDDVGVFFISPCAAKVTAVKSPRGFAKSAVSGVISIKDIYKDLFSALQGIKEEETLVEAGSLGVSWARTDGEASALGKAQHIAVDGITHVIDLLEALEDGQIENIKFIELMCCPGGCVGGPVTIENPYVAKSRVIEREKKALKNGSVMNWGLKQNSIETKWDEIPEECHIFQLDSNYKKAMKMMEELEIIQEGLPGLDCGSCGAPTCRSLAEDIVRGRAKESDCIFKLRDSIRNLTSKMVDLETNFPSNLKEK